VGVGTGLGGVTGGSPSHAAADTTTRARRSAASLRSLRKRPLPKIEIMGARLPDA